MEHLQGWFTVFAGVALFRLGILGGGGLLLQRTRWAKRRVIYALPVAPGQYASEFRAALAVIAFDALYQPLLLTWASRSFAPATVSNVLFTVALGFVLNELWFYVSHRLMHTRALYFIHAQHHTARVTDPLTTMSFSLAEHVIGFVPITLCIAALAHVLPLSGVGMAVFGVLTEVGNLYGHANIEPWSSRQASSPLGRIFGAPTFHAMHHARYSGHFGLYTRILDRWFGTEFPDYEALQARVANGQPLTQLSERAAPKAPGRVAAGAVTEVAR